MEEGHRKMWITVLSLGCSILHFCFCFFITLQTRNVGKLPGINFPQSPISLDDHELSSEHNFFCIWLISSRYGWSFKSK